LCYNLSNLNLVSLINLKVKGKNNIIKILTNIRLKLNKEKEIFQECSKANKDRMGICSGVAKGKINLLMKKSDTWQESIFKGLSISSNSSIILLK
jgi:hypothetical protein